MALNFSQEGVPDEVIPYRTKHLPKDVYCYKYQSYKKLLDSECNFSATVRHDKEFVGFLGAFPVVAQYKGKIVEAYWTCDLYVCEQYRGKGIAGKLYDAVETDKELLIGFGTSDMAYPLKLKRGWRANNDVKEYFFRNSPSTLKQIPRWIKSKSIKVLNINLKSIKGDHTVSETVEEQKINALWQSIKDDYINMVVRDASYFKWRYCEHEAANSYRFIISYDEQGGYEAMLVVRKSNQTVKIVDYLGPKECPNLKIQLLNTAFNYYEEFSLMQCISSCEDWQSALKDFGFYEYSKRPRFTILEPTSSTTAQEDDWFIMLSDSDGELLEALSDTTRG